MTEYIDNDINKGIKIDWGLVRKEFKKLKVPANSYNPLKADFSKIGYYIDLSDRSRGKTTNKLLVGLLLNKLYGIQLQYIRQRSLDIEPKMIRNLYETVKKHKYIEKIYDDMYNDIIYIGKRWYLVSRDENGEIIKKSNNHVTICFGLDESDSLKSTYNAPLGDMIFYDEFITSLYGYSDFVRFCDICKTIIRDRISPIIFMSANTIDINTPWFDEFGIRSDIELLQMGDSKYIETDYGTHIYVEILGKDISEQRSIVNRKFWGFKNPKLASITGKGGWATENFQHIPKRKEKTDETILFDNLYITLSEKFLKLSIVETENRGICVYVTPAKKPERENVHILTIGEITDSRYLFGIGQGKFFKYLWNLYKRNKFYYARNSEGSMLKAYLSLVHGKQRDMIL